MTRRPAELSDADRATGGVTPMLNEDGTPFRVGGIPVVHNPNLPENVIEFRDKMGTLVHRIIFAPEDPPMPTPVRRFAKVRAASAAVKWTALIIGTVLALLAVVAGALAVGVVWE